ncbi:uncharacterized protein [Nicotiana sylvestris]|uniref:uncharacterized protein n=1 Tax=Nicotiana sylvestris TaxID=4096 RepID=UPI00388CEAC8
MTIPNEQLGQTPGVQIDGDQLNQNARNQANQATGIDYNHPLFLSPVDVSGIQIILFQLTRIENYSIWFRSTRVALLGRNKLSMVDDTCKKENFPESMWNHWERVNAIVLTWIMNSVEKELLGEIMYASSAQLVWEDLSERYNKVDGSRTYNLHKEIATLSQGITSKLKLYQFLMRLNDSYSQARSQILMRSHIPTFNLAYTLIVSDEGQKSVAATSGILGSNPTSQARNYEIAMYSKAGGNQNQNQRFRRNYNVYYDFCKIKGHSKENCYKIVGYPADFKNKRKGNAGANASYNVNLMTETDHSNDQQPHVFNYWQNTNMQDQVKKGNSTQTQGSNMNMENSGLEKYVLTKTQYEQILQMLNKTNVSSLTSATNVAGIDTTLLVSNCLSQWIIDTGATNHMVSDKTLLDEKTELFTGKVKGIGKEDGGLYLLYTNTAERNKMLALIARGNDATELFKDLGVIYQRACVYTPQQNGVAERKHRHILEVTRAIRFQAQIPIKFWGHCILVIVYLINRMPSAVIANIYSFERLHKRKSSLLHLRILGCLSFAKIVQEHDKLMPRAKLSIHMGYLEFQKGYILYDPTNKTFFTSRDVIFREDVFPFIKKDNKYQQIFIDTTSLGIQIHDFTILYQNRTSATNANEDGNTEHSEIVMQHNTEENYTDVVTEHANTDFYSF